MKKILFILTICSITLTQELTVEGDLNVTGNIQNQTIDSLLQVIQGLQSQLSGLQSNGGISGRIIEIPVQITQGYVENTLFLNEIIGASQNWYRLSFISAEFSDNGSESINCTTFFGVEGLNYDLNNDFASPSQSIEFQRYDTGEMVIGLEDKSNTTFIISDSNPKFGVRTQACPINGGGYWTGALTLKFLVESDF